IRVQVTDASGQSYVTTKTITINNVDDAPTAINLSASSIDENNAAGATVAKLATTDHGTPATGSSHLSTSALVTSAGDTDNGAFPITGGALKLNPSAYSYTTLFRSIRVQVTDAGGQSYVTTKTITINNVDDAPTAINLSASSIDENNAAGATVA